jgi:hypothetical protein
MCTPRPISWLKRATLFILLFMASASAVSAQTEPAAADLERALHPGMTVWITDSRGREEKVRIDTNADVRRLLAADIAQVTARHPDSVLNGALIGAGSAIATGLFFCTLMEPWENCRDDVGPMVKIGALGAGIGIAIDALFRGRKTIYEPTRGAARVSAAPILTPREKGLRLSFTF